MSIADDIHGKLTGAFTPLAISVTDESARHAGHSGATRADGSAGETHFHIRMVSAAFEGISRVERQRRVHAALAAELSGPVHALSLALLTPQEAERQTARGCPIACLFLRPFGRHFELFCGHSAAGAAGGITRNAVIWLRWRRTISKTKPK